MFIPGKLYKAVKTCTLYKIDNDNVYETIRPEDPGNYLLFLYSKEIKRFSGNEITHHCFLYKNNIYTVALYVIDYGTIENYIQELQCLN